MQKTVTLDYLTHKQVINDNIADKYYLKNAHPVIIHSAVYEIAQTIYNDKVRYSKNLVTKYPLTNLIYCKNCGRTLRRHHLGEVKQMRKICLDCRHTTMDTKPCDASWVEETLVNDTMDQAIKDILSKKKVYQRVLEYYTSNYTLNSLYKRFEDLSEELIEVNNIKANAEGNELKGIHKEETIVKTKIQKIRKDMMHLQRNASTVETLKNCRTIQFKRFLYYSINTSLGSSFINLVNSF